MDATVIEVGERFDRAAVRGVMSDLDAALSAGGDPVILDLGRVETFDSAGMGTVVAGLQAARASGRQVRLRGLSQPMLDFFSLVSVDRLLGAAADKPARLDPVSRVGAAVEPMLRSLRAVVGVAAETAEALFVAPFRGRALRLDRAALEVDTAAGGALPIVALIAFLLGLILAMQAYVQLRVWGAEIYMADMVGVSVMTEIGPLMTAIILAARSGSSNAAQLGAMVVSEEIDALRQMGIHPVRFLVVPKVIALAFAVLALALVFDVVAMCGGALFGSLVAGIELDAYAAQTRIALHMGDFVVACAKAAVFGAIVGVVGCALGLRVEGGSEGVGRATTNAVVFSIFLIIVVDAVFVTAQRMLL